MSVGNLNTQGNKKNNLPYQLSSLQLLDQILQAIVASGGGSCPCPSSAQEATLLQVLGALQNGQEFEQALVMDLGGPGCPGNCPTYIQIRIWDTVNHVFLPPVYYNAAGAVVVPVGPLQFLNPQFVLENILTQVTAINADLDVALSTRASEATLANVLTTAAFQARINTLGQKAMAASTPVVLASDQSAIPVTGTFFPTPVVRTTTLQRATAAGSILVGAGSVTVANTGAANGLVLGSTIKPGESFTWSAGPNDTLNAIPYDGTGTELTITTVR